MKAVILAGGLGERLKPFTQVIPKPLLPVGESSVLEIQLQTLKIHGVDEVFIATNYKSKFVEAFLSDHSKYGMQISFSKEKKPLGTCGPLVLLKDRLTEPFFLMNGDILTNLNFERAYKFALEMDTNLVVITTEITTPFNFGKVRSEDNYLIDIEEKPDFILEVLAGIYIMKPPIFKFIPEDTYYGMDSLIKDMLAEHMKIGTYQMHEYWLDIGRIEDYQTAMDVYEEHFNHLK